MPDYQPIDYRLRCHTKRTDLPVDVLRDICEAYAEITRLQRERDEARLEILQHLHPDVRQTCAAAREWDCFNTPEAKVAKTLNGVIVNSGKAVPLKYENLDND